MTHHLSSTTAALLMAMGGIAYNKAGSTASLVSCSTLSGCFVGCSYLIAKTDNTYVGCALGTIGGLTTLGLGTWRYQKSQKKTVPLTIMAIGLVNAAYYGMKAYEWRS